MYICTHICIYMRKQRNLKKRTVTMNLFQVQNCAL